MAKEKKSFNNYVTGIIIGAIIPPIAVYLFYATQNLHMSFDGFLNYIFKYHVASKVLSVALVANLAGFYLFLQTKRDFSAKGVIAMTLLYAIATMIYMFLF